jgi:hypothetical protein
MKLSTKLIVMAASVLSLPAASYGQSYSSSGPSYSQPTYPRTAGPDVAYCEKLSNIYARYIGHDWDHGEYERQRANNDAQVAMTQCQTNTPFAISVLERELRNNRFTLPPRG